MCPRRRTQPSRAMAYRATSRAARSLLRRARPRTESTGGSTVYALSMEQVAALPIVDPVADAAQRPEISVVVTLYDEAATVEELLPRTVAALERAWPTFELVFVDDGSDRRHLRGRRAAARRRPACPSRPLQAQLRPAPCDARGARARPRRHRRDDGRRPAEPAGGHPAAVDAVDAGCDVASGRRAAREDTWGRTLPSRLINGMLRRFTGVAIADFGCAFNAYRRSALEPMLGVDRPAEVHEGARPLRRRVGRRGRCRARRRARAARATRRFGSRALALHVLAGFWPQPIQWAGVDARRRLHAGGHRRSAPTASSSGSASRTSRGRCSAASRSSSCWASRGSCSRSSASTSGASNGWSSTVRSIRSTGSYEQSRREFSSPAGRGSSRRTSCAICSSTRRTRSCRSTRSPTRARSRTSPT